MLKMKTVLQRMQARSNCLNQSHVWLLWLKAAGFVFRLGWYLFHQQQYHDPRQMDSPRSSRLSNLFAQIGCLVLWHFSVWSFHVWAVPLWRYGRHEMCITNFLIAPTCLAWAAVESNELQIVFIVKIAFMNTIFLYWACLLLWAGMGWGHRVATEAAPKVRIAWAAAQRGKTREGGRVHEREGGTHVKREGERCRSPPPPRPQVGGRERKEMRDRSTGVCYIKNKLV